MLCPVAVRSRRTSLNKQRTFASNGPQSEVLPDEVEDHSKSNMTDTKNDKLYALAWDRLEGRQCGYGIPILWHLALRRYEPAMVVLSQRIEAHGPISDAFSSAGLIYRAYRQGSPIAAQNLAVECFNRRDLGGYRMWLGRAARLGDGDAAREHRRFETRLPHSDAGKIGRKRPLRSYDDC